MKTFSQISSLMVILTGIATQSAFATGGYSCTVNDKNIDLEIGGTLSHGIPGRPWNESGHLTLKDAKLNAVYALPTITKSDMFWLADRELKVMVYNEPTTTAKFSTEELVILANFDEKSGSFVGEYRLELGLADDPPVTLKGPISCDLE